MNSEGRSINGRFGSGNSYGKGRPARAAEQDYLSALSEICTAERWKSIIERAITDAEQGEAKARMFLASYLMGRPVQRMQVNDEMDPATFAERLAEEMREMDEIMHGPEGILREVARLASRFKANGRDVSELLPIVQAASLEKPPALE